MDVEYLFQLWQRGGLELAPEFQRNTKWPLAAKAYLIDTILQDKPIPALLLNARLNAQSGEKVLSVVDGQQRLNAVFEFIDNRFGLTESPPDSGWHGMRFGDLASHLQRQVLRYEFLVDQLDGYSSRDVIDVFERINRFVIPMTRQELRHATMSGHFHDFVVHIAEWDFWLDKKIFTASSRARRRVDEYVAELAVLLVEGPQDRRHGVDFYYSAFQEEFSEAAEVERALSHYVSVVDDVLPDLSKSPLRRPASLYSIIGALDQLRRLHGVVPTPKELAPQMRDFAKMISASDEIGSMQADEYLESLQAGADSLRNRWRRIDILLSIFESGPTGDDGS